MENRVNPLAGKKPASDSLLSADELQKRYLSPDLPLNAVKNGTSGHRGKTGKGFCQAHVQAITQTLIDIRKERGTFGPGNVSGNNPTSSTSLLGPVLIGKDVRFTSDLAQRTAVEVFAGNGIQTVIHKGERSVPTPVISHQILQKNAQGENVEGVIITASHNPPEDAGYKSNGFDGGPNTRTAPIDVLANQYMENPTAIKRVDYDVAVQKGLVTEEDMLSRYVDDLPSVVRMDVIKGGQFAVTPLGGAAHGYYEAVNAVHGTNITVALPDPDPASANRTYDWDGKLRGDPSSVFVMKAVEGYREKFGVPFIGANDNDADRFGGEDSTGILNPNHVLCVVFDYLCRTRGFASTMGIGRTIGSTHMLDLIASDYGRPVKEVNVGFKWYVSGLKNREFVLAGEESAGFSLPRLDGSLWVTEKDGIAAVLLMMEIIADSGDDIGTLYSKLVDKHGPHQYERLDMPATPAKKARLQELCADPEETRKLLQGKVIAGRKVEGLVIGDGVKVVLADGVWVLKRASGTEDIIKDYREERGDSLKAACNASEEIDHFLGLAGI